MSAPVFTSDEAEAGKQCTGFWRSGGHKWGDLVARRFLEWEPEFCVLESALLCWQGSSLCLGFMSEVLFYNLMAVWFQWKYGLSCKKDKPHDPRIQPGNFHELGMWPDVPLLKDILQLFTGLILSSWRQWPSLSTGWMEVYKAMHWLWVCLFIF